MMTKKIGVFLCILTFPVVIYADIDFIVPSVCLKPAALALNNPECKPIYQAAALGVHKLNNDKNGTHRLQLVRLMKAMIVAVNNEAKYSVFDIVSQVAPLSCEFDDSNAPEEIEDGGKNCSVLIEKSEAYEMLIRRYENGSCQSLKVRKLNVKYAKKGLKISDKTLPNLLPIDGLPVQGAADSSKDFTPAFVFSVLVGVSGLISVATIVLRRSEFGYSSIDSKLEHELKGRSSNINTTKVLTRSNPVPKDDEVTLTRSHEHHERFAV